MDRILFETLNRKLKSVADLPDWLLGWENLGEQIRSIRQALSMTQTQMAKRMGSTQNMIAKLEAAKMDVKVQTLRKAAAALECELQLVLVPKLPLKETLWIRAKQKALSLLGFASKSSHLEMQAPSQKIFDERVEDLRRELFEHKRKALWDD